MPTYLRFTPDEFRTIARASRPLPLGGSLHAFRHFLVDSLREARPALAARLAAIRKDQVRLLFEYLKGRRSSGGRARKAGGAEAQAACDLTLAEWQAVSQAGAAFRLHDRPPPFKGFLLGHVGGTSPALAEKLARFSDGQIARLYRRVHSGRRWCA